MSRAEIITAIIGIVILVSATWIPLHIYRSGKFNQAAKAFIAAFQDELTRLKLESTSTYDIINPARIKHSEACFTFRKYLRGRELGRFNLAWHKYYLTPPYQDEKQTEKEDTNERTALIERIEELLDFAKFK